MRHGAAGRRSRYRGQGGGGHNHNNQRRGGGGGVNNRMHVFDSNGPEVRIRGTANQICEKYLTLAKDAASQGNRVLSESYLQHAEHYQRIINSWVAETPHYADRPNAEGDVNVPSQPFVEQPAMVMQGAEDLGLPASIIGASRVSEMADA